MSVVFEVGKSRLVMVSILIHMLLLMIYALPVEAGRKLTDN